MAAEPADVARWLEAARAGSRDALGEALEACRAYLLAVANRQVDDALRAKGGASDLVQETFLEAQRDFDRFQGNSADELRAWLCRLLVNNAANFARAYRETDKRQVGREVGLPGEAPSDDGRGGGLPGPTPTPSVQAVAKELAQRVEHCLDRLPDDYRQVITLRYREDRPFDEIARLMGRSENAVRKLWFRAIERLQQELDSPS
jgi:RNA polymerase sigma-70 factor, ECF subfamily